MADEMTVERARALLEAATPGKWTRSEGSGAITAEDGTFVAGGTWPRTGDLVAAAPDLARAYLAACEERDRLRSALQYAADAYELGREWEARGAVAAALRREEGATAAAGDAADE